MRRRCPPTLARVTCLVFFLSYVLFFSFLLRSLIFFSTFFVSLSPSLFLNVERFLLELGTNVACLQDLSRLMYDVSPRPTACTTVLHLNSTTANPDQGIYANEHNIDDTTTFVVVFTIFTHTQNRHKSARRERRRDAEGKYSYHHKNNLQCT